MNTTLEQKARRLAAEIVEATPWQISDEVDNDVFLTAILGAEAYFATHRRGEFAESAEEITRKVLEAWLSGRSSEFIARLLGITRSAVHSILCMHNYDAPYIEDTDYSIKDVNMVATNPDEAPSRVLSSVMEEVGDRSLCSHTFYKPGTPSKDEIKQLIDMYCAGMSYEVLSRMSGRIIDEVIFILKTNGVIVVDRESLIKCYRQGMSVNYISLLLNIPFDLVLEELNLHGYIVPRTPEKDFNLSQMISLSYDIERVGNNDVFVYKGDGDCSLGTALAVECSKVGRVSRENAHINRDNPKASEFKLIRLLLRMGVTLDKVAWMANLKESSLKSIQKSNEREIYDELR